jgi:hypothetical protein
MANLKQVNLFKIIRDLRNEEAKRPVADRAFVLTDNFGRQLDALTNKGKGFAPSQIKEDIK